MPKLPGELHLRITSVQDSVKQLRKKARQLDQRIEEQISHLISVWEENTD